VNTIRRKLRPLLFLALFAVLALVIWIALHVWFEYLDHYIERHIDNGTFISRKGREDAYSDVA
jgi:hypothetical protein